MGGAKFVSRIRTVAAWLVPAACVNFFFVERFKDEQYPMLGYFSPRPPHALFGVSKRQPYCAGRSYARLGSSLAIIRRYRQFDRLFYDVWRLMLVTFDRQQSNIPAPGLRSGINQHHKITSLPEIGTCCFSV